MLRFNLKDAMQAYEAKTGIHLTYEELSNLSSISVETIKSIATRPGYNATLKMITEVALALNINPVNYFEWNGTKNEK